MHARLCVLTMSVIASGIVNLDEKKLSPLYLSIQYLQHVITWRIKFHAYVLRRLLFVTIDVSQSGIKTSEFDNDCHFLLKPALKNVILNNIQNNRGQSVTPI